MLEFREDTHEYFLDGKKLISVTQLMRKHGLAPSYDGIDPAVLKAAAEKGTYVHLEIEEYNKEGKIGFTSELAYYIDYINENEVKVKASELKIHNDIVAGTCDLILNYGKGQEVIADIKTTSVLHKEAVSWQLSIYAFLIANDQAHYLIFNGQAFHFDSIGKLKVVDIPLKPYEEIERLMDCERKGVLYTQEVAIEDKQISEIAELEQIISDLDAQKKAAEEKQKALKEAMMEEMVARGLTSFEKGNLKITYVAPTTRTSIDSARLKKELPDIAEKYSKTSEVKASLKITLKKNVIYTQEPLIEAIKEKKYDS